MFQEYHLSVNFGYFDMYSTEIGYDFSALLNLGIEFKTTKKQELP